MEITYDTGAKVILQGPVTYEVESPASGYLLIGKLTARVESTKSQAANQKSEILNHKLFVVRTPTATVTDLGTEFGVEVDKSGATASHIFRGAVELRSISGVGPPGGDMIRMLREGQSSRVERSGKVQVTFDASAESHFVRSMPKRNGPVWAQLRPDYDRHIACQGESGEACMPDSFGAGAWGFFSSHTENPAAADAELQALTYATTANHYRNAGSYVALGQLWDLPGVKNAQLIADSPEVIRRGETEDAPPTDSIAMHPGYEKERRQYLVVRWKPGKSEEGAIHISGVVRDIGIVGNGITFSIYVDGVERYPSRVVALWGGPRFDVRADVKPGSHVDFVVGNNGDWCSDQSSLAVTIVKQPVSQQPNEQNGIP